MFPGIWGLKAGPPATGSCRALGGCTRGSGLTLCLGHLREKLSSVNKQPVRRGQGCVRGHPALRSSCPRVGGMQCPPGPWPLTSHSVCVKGSAEVGQACDTCQCCQHSGHHHPGKPVSHEPTDLGATGPMFSWLRECPGPRAPSPWPSSPVSTAHA